jgi:hypothetical protein
MRKSVIYASIAGFLIPVLCGLAQMLLFNGKDGGWEAFVCYQLPNVLCPPWALGNGMGFWMIAIPVLNAILYCVIALCVVTAIRLGRAPLR